MRGPLRYVWALPASMVGLLLASPCIAAGGTARTVDGVLEVSAEALAEALRANGILRGSIVITFGHVILGTEHELLDRFRRHEHVHVAQYERWGALLFPLYVASSLLAWLRGRDPYTGNHFERAAFRAREGA